MKVNKKMKFVVATLFALIASESTLAAPGVSFIDQSGKKQCQLYHNGQPTQNSCDCGVGTCSCATDSNFCTNGFQTGQWKIIKTINTRK